MGNKYTYYSNTKNPYNLNNIVKVGILGVRVVRILIAHQAHGRLIGEIIGLPIPNPRFNPEELIEQSTLKSVVDHVDPGLSRQLPEINRVVDLRHVFVRHN